MPRGPEPGEETQAEPADDDDDDDELVPGGPEACLPMEGVHRTGSGGQSLLTE